jgi:hypothetical protein
VPGVSEHLPNSHRLGHVPPAVTLHCKQDIHLV